MEFAAITESEIGAAGQFLRTTFGSPPDWLAFRDDVMRWKALKPHPLWNGGRGYVIRQEGSIVAHGCAMPWRLVSADRAALGTLIIDWAGSKAMPGGGALIYSHIGKSVECLFGVGGSDDAQRVLPRIGFKPRQEFLCYTRVLNPVAVFAESDAKDWKTPARLARNVLDRLKPVPRVQGWSTERVTRFDEVKAPCPDVIARIICHREAALLNYFLDCPAARMEGYILNKDGKPAGYCILAHVRRECRIADLWVDSAKEEDWLSAYLLATELAGDAIQVTAGCSVAVPQRALERAGFRLSGRQPIYVKDPKSAIPADLDLSISLLETDFFYG